MYTGLFLLWWHYNSSVAEHWTIFSYALYVVCTYFVSLIQLLLPNQINHYYCLTFIAVVQRLNSGHNRLQVVSKTFISLSSRKELWMKWKWPKYFNCSINSKHKMSEDEKNPQQFKFRCIAYTKERAKYTVSQKNVQTYFLPCVSQI